MIDGSSSSPSAASEAQRARHDGEGPGHGAPKASSRCCQHQHQHQHQHRRVSSEPSSVAHGDAGSARCAPWRGLLHGSGPSWRGLLHDSGPSCLHQRSWHHCRRACLHKWTTMLGRCAWRLRCQPQHRPAWSSVWWPHWSTRRRIEPGAGRRLGRVATGTTPHRARCFLQTYRGDRCQRRSQSRSRRVS